jgi:glutamate dehydrogenase
MINRVGSTFVHRIIETTGSRPDEIVRAYLLNREIFGFASLWQRSRPLINKVDRRRAIGDAD